MNFFKHILLAVGFLCLGILQAVATPKLAPNKHHAALVAISWIGGTAGFETDWNTPTNWSTGSIPGAGDDVTINGSLTHYPVLNNNTSIQSLNVQAGASLTINASRTLTISGAGTNYSINLIGTINNNGTIAVTAAYDAIYLEGNAQFNNNAGATVSVTTTGNYGFKLYDTAVLTNQTGAIINSTGASGSLFIYGNNTSLEMAKNYGKMTLTGQIEKYTDTFHNYPCGVVLLTSGEVYNNGGQIINEGFFSAPANLNGAATDFINDGIVYVSGLASYTNNKIRVFNNAASTSIFEFGASNDLTVAGIYKDDAATASAGDYNQATNTFTHFGLSAGSQTLYAKITRPGGTCPQIVPFTFDVTTASIFTTQPGNQVACPGGVAVFTVAIANAASYQWELNTGSGWNNVPAAAPYTNTTTATLNISNVTGLNGYQYRCVASSAGGATLTSTAGTLTISTGGGSNPTGTLTWTGAVDTNWNTACNWLPASVPTATNDVVIPNTTNKPIINTAALAQSVEVLAGAMLTINATRSLTINGSKSVSFSTTGFYNNGTVQNHGQLILGNTGSVGQSGIVNHATFINNTGAEITIDRATSQGLVNYTGGLFTNAAKITIGANANVGQTGFNNFATFNNNTGGEITINRSISSGLNNAVGGTFTNSAKIFIGTITPKITLGLDNRAAFFNNAGGEITIDNTTAIGLLNSSDNLSIYPPGTFTNAGKITIGATALASIGLANANSATFANNTGGEIKIDRSTLLGLNNEGGTFNNAAKITIGALASVGYYGINNQANFNNNAGGEIKIDNSTQFGLLNATGSTFTNAAKMTIGATASVGNRGLVNDNGLFNNTTGGDVSITRATEIGLFNTNGGTLTNVAKIRVDGAAYGIHNYNSSFQNNTNGEIKVDNSLRMGVFHESGTFTNLAKLSIKVLNSGSDGLLNKSIFNNSADGVIEIDGASSTYLANQLGTFTNAAQIKLGSLAATEAIKGIENDALFNNNLGGEITINNAKSGFANAGGTFTNNALITITSSREIDTHGLINVDLMINNACGKIIVLKGVLVNRPGYTFTNLGLVQVVDNLENNGTFTNNGILKYGSLTGTVTNATNSSLIVNNTPTPIFTYGGTYNGVINGIFTDAAATISAGTFTAPNTFVPAGLPAGVQTLYAKITPQGGACSYVVPFSYTNPVVSSALFITRWNLATAGSGATQLRFGVSTSGTVNYTWTTVPAGTSGSGTFSGSIATITGLPGNTTIDLAINPTNFQRITVNISGPSDENRLIDVKQWGEVVWTSMENAFNECNNLNITATDVPNLNNVTNMRRMFRDCSTLNGPSNINSWNTATITNMSGLFDRANAFNQPIGSWNTAAVTDMSYMFGSATNFNQPIGNWNTAAVTDMSYMFGSATNFNQPIGNWNTAAVNKMSDMFAATMAFNQPIGTWNTAAVTDMSAMFQNARAFNQPIGMWNTAAVTDMSDMFYGAHAFNQPVGSWNTAAVTNMSWMFYFAKNFNQPIGAWNTAAVTSMSVMFRDAHAFNQSLGTWTLKSNVNLSSMLNNSGMDCANYSATLMGWANNPATPNGRELGADGRQYGTDAVAARTTLTTSKGWTIYGDAASGVACVPAEIDLKGNTISIINGDTTPDLADHTDFDAQYVVSGTVVRTFTIENSGIGPLTLTGTPKVAISGPNAADFTVSTQPSSPIAPTNGTTTFQITFTPSSSGLRTATVSIANNDDNENPYTFAIQGTGACGFTLATGTVTNIATCGGTGSIAFTTNLPDNTYSVAYTATGTGATVSPQSVTVSGGAFVLSGLSAGTYSNFTIVHANCNITASASISLTPPAAPTITTSVSAAICAGATSFTIPYTTTTGTPISYSISGTGITTVANSTLPASPIVVNLSSPATGSSITYLLTVSNASGCISSNVSGNVTVNTSPTANISYAGTPFCKSLTAGAVTRTGTAGGTFSSTMGLTINPTTGEINPSTSTEGIYTVNYNIAASGGCAAVNATTSVTIYSVLTVTITGSTSVCQNAPFPQITFAATGGTPPYTFTYKINNGIPQTITTSENSVIVSQSTTTTGEFTYTLVNTSDQCSQTQGSSAVVIVNALPELSFTGANPACQWYTSKLWANTPGSWTTNDPTKATIAQDGTISALLDGQATFTFTVAATGCQITSKPLIIKPTPVSALIASKNDVCPNTEVSLDARCSIPTSTVNWSPGAPTVTPAAATLPYVYKARCTADGCTGNESSVEVRTHRILVDMKDLDVGALPLPIVRAVKDNMAPTNLIQAPVFPRRWTFIANGCDASESAEFKLSGPVLFNTIDNAGTYAMFANEGNSFYSIDHPNYGNGGSFPNGTYTLTINFYSKDGVGGPFPKNRIPVGILLATRTLEFTVGGQQSIVGGRQSAVVGPSHGSEQWTVGSGQWAVVAPNPVSNTMRLKVMDLKGQQVKVNLIDAAGRMMLQHSFTPDTNQHQEEFEVSQLSAGMYFLNVNTENKNATIKVVKVE